MLLDSMRRADRAYWKMLKMLELEAEKMVGLPKKERWPLINKLKKQVDPTILSGRAQRRTLPTR